MVSFRAFIEANERIVILSFLLSIKGFDTHSNVEEVLTEKFVEVNEAFSSFENELKSMGLWNNVTTIQVSDFARTLNPNGGEGTDHAWGGNYMMFGEFTL